MLIVIVTLRPFYKHNINKIEHFIKYMAIPKISPNGNVSLIKGYN